MASPHHSSSISSTGGGVAPHPCLFPLAGWRIRRGSPWSVTCKGLPARVYALYFDSQRFFVAPEVACSLNRAMSKPLLAAAEPWGDDEWFLLGLSAVVCVVGLIWLARCFRVVPKLGRRAPVRRFILLALVTALGAMLWVTWQWSDEVIRGGQAYSWLVMAMGGAWLTACGWMFPCLGVSLQEDACERANPAATAVVCGAGLGAALIFCAANTGEGPSFWNNVFSVLSGGVVWFGSWFALETTTRVSRAVTEDRDVASGVRLGGFLLATGLVLGRALAGDWHSAAATLNDLLRDGWLVVLLLGLAIGVERVLKPTPTMPCPFWITRGIPAALGYVALALAWVAQLGWWEGAPP